MRRHFTATGFVVQGSRTLLHWHKRLQQWMPPGGHIEPDEDPVQAVLREIQEETGATAEVIPSVQGRQSGGGGAELDGEHVGCLGGADAGQCVLHGEAVLWSDTEAPGGGEK